jgi:predicted kinase
MQCVIFVGIPASGKSSYFQQQFFDTHVRINLDMLKTRHREGVLLNACIEGKQPFVVDNTNPSPEDRHRYIAAAKNAGFEVIGYYFQSRVSDALDRNRLRTRQVPQSGIRSISSKLVLPTMDEGFDALFYVAIEDNEFTVAEWQSEEE